jgi:hypothetical protein
MSNTKLTLPDIFALTVAVSLALFSIFLIGKMVAGGNVSSYEFQFLTLIMVVNATCVLMRK